MTHTILRLGHHGDGIAEGRDGPLYAPRTLPGEEIAGDVSRDRIADPKILTPSPDRVSPPCPHYRRCGGCHLQHASDGFVAEWRRDVVLGALARAGIEAEIRGVETSAPNTRRRAALSGRKTKKGAQVGFHVRGSDEIVEIPDCRVLDAALLRALPMLDQVTRLAAVRGGEITLHVTATDTGIDLSVEGAKPFDRAVMLALAPLGQGFARITWNGETALQQTPPVVRLGAASVTPPPGAFLQATPEGHAALVAVVAEALAGARHVVDLFAGCGTFSFPLSETSPVHAVEGERALADALAMGARHATGLRAVTTETRDLFRNPLLPEELKRFDAAVIDPPRAGAEAQVAQIAASRIARVASVSCNPGTFARDAATLLVAGFAIGPVTIVDQFRWSPHIEVVAGFFR